MYLKKNKNKKIFFVDKSNRQPVITYFKLLSSVPLEPSVPPFRFLLSSAKQRPKESKLLSLRFLLLQLQPTSLSCCELAGERSILPHSVTSLVADSCRVGSLRCGCYCTSCWPRFVSTE